MEDKNFNFIELTEEKGKGEIKIDKTLLKGVSNYVIKRNTDIVELSITISVPPKNFITNANP